MRFGCLILVAGMLVGCGNSKSTEELKVELCRASQDLVQTEATLDGTASEQWIEKARTDCGDIVADETKFETLARAHLVNRLEGLPAFNVKNAVISEFEPQAFLGKRFIGDIAFLNQEQRQDQKFSMYLDKSNLVWNVDVRDSSDEMKKSATGVIGIWCNVREYADGRNVNVIEIEKIEASGTQTGYRYEVRAFSDRAESTQAGYPADYIDGRFKLTGDRFTNSTMEYKIDGKGYLHTISKGIESGVATPITGYDNPGECDRL